ncbi:helix-turn-helix domain-containing protein [Deinococcus sp.]|uniref:helix-turn-helix domain-containing protein n=1 Tax=Deinococcus sp. TaxID=47478 RepID=UPI003B5B18CA
MGLPTVDRPAPDQAQRRERQVSPEQYRAAQLWLAAGKTKGEVAAAMGVSRQTLYAALKRLGKAQPESASRPVKPPRR